MLPEVPASHSANAPIGSGRFYRKLYRVKAAPLLHYGPMRLLVLVLLAAQPVATMSELMVQTIYPASDAVFYIATRTPRNDGEWKELEAKTVALAKAADAMTTPLYFRDRDRWMADARL